ncbi:MAG: Protein translocase subunit SecA [Candidatus Methanoperedenaceae archaeon GB37]|nr:MAG: Protein translocase subunit SecA [Candidatus Methanoperedenaceae archaeon GB37]
MLARILTKLVGTKNERELNHLGEIVDRINQLEPRVSKLSDIQLRAKTAEFKQQISKWLPSWMIYCLRPLRWLEKLPYGY